MIRSFKKELLLIFCFLVLVTVYLEFAVYFYVFLRAYVHPEKMQVIFINNYGEADSELVLFSCLLLFGFISLIVIGYELIRKQT